MGSFGKPLMMMLRKILGLELLFSFQVRKMSIEDLSHPGCPSTERNDENIAKTKAPKLTLRRRRSHHQQLPKFERGCVIRLREGGLSSLDTPEKLGWNISTVHDCEQWSRDGTISRKPGFGRPRGSTEREDRHIRRLAVEHRTAFCLRASDGRVLFRRRSGERLQPNCLRPRHTGPTPGVMVWRTISYENITSFVVIRNTLTINLYVNLVIQSIVLPFMNSTQGGVFQQDNVRLHTTAVTQRALQSVDMLHWPARSPYLSPIERVWDIIGRQLQHHPQPALTVQALTQVQQERNSIPQSDIWHLYDTMHARLQACIQNSGGYTVY
ncbi:transposable element Tc1 transposase [Trichonephila clavipes]|nr:transposable element Tc1 transposase [Trichonephila clavipes]